MKQAAIFRAMMGALVGSAAFIALLVAGPAQSVSVTIDASACANWTWNSATRTLSCDTVQPPPAPAGAPTGCTPSISTNPAALTSAGGTATLNVTGCVPSTGLSYAWTKNGASFSSAQSPVDTLPGNTSTTAAATTSYQVRICNGSACTNSLPATPLSATVPAASVVGGGGDGTISCSAQGFSKTVFYDWDWASTVPQVDTAYMPDTAGGKGVGPNGILVVAFTPTGPAENNNLSFIDAIGYPSPNQGNVMTLSISNKPCDLSIPDPGTSVSYAPTVTYGIGTVGVRWWDNKPTALALTPGVRYYINVAGRSGGANTCVPGAFGSCEIRLAFRKPAGH
jgi:hypothetical protein